MQPPSPSEHAHIDGEIQAGGPGIGPPAPEKASWASRGALAGLAASVVLHAILLAALAVFVPRANLRPAEPPQSVSVEVLSPQQFAILTHPDAEILATPPAPAPE